MVTRAYIVGGSGGSGDAVIGGLSVVLRQALSLQDAGVEQVFVIDGPADRLRADRRLRLRVEERGADAAGSDADAIVAAAGTIWHPSIVARLARTSIDAGRAIACASDAGHAAIYLCGRNRVAEIVAALASGRSIGDAAPSACRPGEFIATTTTDADRRVATTLLLRSLQKPSDGLASRYLHRPISRAVTRWLLPWPVTPNAMTLFAAVFGVAGAIVASRGGYWRVLAGAALFEVQNILDGCDGEIARLKYLRSRGGEWLDQVIDDVLNIAFLIAVAIALTRGGSRYAMWTAVVAAAAQAIHAAGLYAGLLLKGGGRGSVARLRWWVGGGQGGSVAGDLTRRDILSAAYVVAAALDLVAVIFVWHAALTVGSAVVTTLQWIVWGGPGVQTEGDGVADGAAAV